MIENCQNLVELGEESCRRHRDLPLFGTKRAKGWVWTTYGEFQSLVDDFRAGLAALGVGKGDRVAIVSNNRVEWAVAAYASYGLGGTFVPLYEAQRADEWEFILRDSATKVAIGSSEPIAAALEEMRARLPQLEHVIGLERAASSSGSYENLLQRGRERPVASRHPKPDSIAGFIYTSGTTGRPKGVMLTHANITSNVEAGLSVFPVSSEDRTLSFLPWAHAYGQVIELHLLVSAGASTAFNTELPKLLDELAEVQPTMLIAVPRIFNKIYAKLTAQFAEKPRPIRALLAAAIRTASRKRRHEKVGVLDELGLKLADRVAFSKVRAKLGGRLRYAITASAAIDREVAELIDAIGIQVYEGYGLTETSPIVAGNYPGTRLLGSVGKSVPGVRIEIDPRSSEEPGGGEIIVYGPNVMAGYHNRPDENAKAFTPTGGLRTGDIGRLDSEGFLHITGRLKDQYKLENGKYVMPAPLEETLKLSPYIANVMIEGANRPFNAAVVVIEREKVEAWARQNGVSLGADLTADLAVRALVASEIDRLAAKFKGFEKPRAFVLTVRDFTVEDGTLTPTLKIKRRAVLARHASQLDALYRQDQTHAPRPA